MFQHESLKRTQEYKKEKKEPKNQTQYKYRKLKFVEKTSKEPDKDRRIGQ